MIKELIAAPFAAALLHACSSDDAASPPAADAGPRDAAIGDGATTDGATGDASGGDGGTSGVPTCTDGAKNGGETDVDCGGTCAVRCAIGKACAVSADCASGTCGATKTCVAAPALCKIDGFTWVAAQNKYLVIAKGKAWWLDGSNALVGAGIDLYTLPGLANGPCAGQVGACRIDAMAYRNDGNQVYIFRGSHVWVLNENIAPVSDFEFTQIPGLVNGPCAAQLGGACRIDSASYNREPSHRHPRLRPGAVPVVLRSGSPGGDKLVGRLRNWPTVSRDAPAKSAGAANGRACSVRTNLSPQQSLRERRTHFEVSTGVLRGPASQRPRAVALPCGS